MASARHRPLQSSSSSARNPFDSSDDEDEVKRAVPTVRSNHRQYSNPFDDDKNHGKAPSGRPIPASKPFPRNPPQTVAYGKNPFDDDDADDGAGAPRPFHKKPPQTVDYGKNPFDDYDADDDAGARAPSLKAKLDQGTLFDEEPRFHDDLSAQEHKSRTKTPAKSALLKVQKFKDAGSSQASRMVEGGIHQAQRLKESSVSAFKNEEKGKPAVSGNARNQVFEEDTRRGAFDKRGQVVYGKGQGFSDEGHGTYESGSLGMPARATTHYDDYQFQGTDLEQRSVQDLEGYALQKSEDTTKRVQNCLKVAEDIKGDATRTLVSLHQQGEQLKRTHELAYDIDQNLTAGEKLLGSLGGMFSRTWKPKKGPAITGPVDDPSDFQIRRKGHHLEQRTALGLDAKRHTDRPPHSTPDFESQTTEAKLEVEKTKQDDALSDLSNVLDQLKEMSMDMGTEIARQNVSLDHFQNDVSTLDERVKGANVRGRRLLGK